MLHVPDDSVLVLVDFQTRLMPAIHDGAPVVAQAVRLGRIARIFEVPVIGTEQSPLRLGESVSEIKGLCSDTVAKDHFDACADGLADALPAERDSVIVAGCEAHVCVLQTALGLLRTIHRSADVAPAAAAAALMFPVGIGAVRSRCCVRSSITRPTSVRPCWTCAASSPCRSRSMLRWLLYGFTGYSLAPRVSRANLSGHKNT
ncbi:isochorismatase hydrolase [Burkholderia ambifaria MEX-5]|uniref:Isochorismatase hydrolase n=1 Tax=Burkholderia ambifaria MEX-5 TaxID=396597 RepID=B1T8T0_9BURK|nr:isochorismatase hydrolase [Burkholderia ambifaria MEX-5]